MSSMCRSISRCASFEMMQKCSCILSHQCGVPSLRWWLQHLHLCWHRLYSQHACFACLQKNSRVVFRSRALHSLVSLHRKGSASDGFRMTVQVLSGDLPLTSSCTSLNLVFKLEFFPELGRHPAKAANSNSDFLADLLVSICFHESQ